MQAEPANHHLYNADLQPFAQRLRNHGTKAEACLWKYALRAGQMRGYEFRRQRPVLNYIADFLCFELKLVIETDGLSHLWDETAERDGRKEQALTEAGFTLLRFSDQEVLRNMASVRQQIEWWIEAWEEKQGVAQKPSALPPPA